jgi:Sulfotransferase domain
MTIQVIGAGLGRTGTLSLKLALERLLGGPCHHMVELFNHPQQVQGWERALDGRTVDWDALLADYRAVVDWTAAAFLPELSAAYPDATVLLSMRDVDEWWRSVHDTTFGELQSEPAPASDPWEAALAPIRQFTIRLLNSRFTPEWADETAAKEAFARHNDRVRAAVPASRLVEWRPGDGWTPLCAALGLPVPAEAFPHVNTTADFLAHNFFRRARNRPLRGWSGAITGP